MILPFVEELAHQVHQRIDTAELLHLIGFHADKMQVSGKVIKAFCPIHQDSRFRSLLLDSESREYRCTIKTCKGYDGGTIIDLYARSRDISFVAALCEIAEKLPVLPNDQWRNQLVQAYLDEAAKYRTVEQIPRKEAVLKELVAAVPDALEARAGLADCLAAAGNHGAALDEYLKLIDFALEKHNVNGAEIAATKATEQFPDNEDILFARVRIADEKGNPELAIQRLREILALREATNRHQDNIGLLESLMNKLPDEPEFNLKLAAIHEQQHNIRETARQYELAAHKHLKNNNLTAGIELLEKAVHYNSDNLNARMELGWRLVETNQEAKAREHIFKCVNQLIEDQQHLRAKEITSRWLEHSPDCIDSRELLARVEIEQGLPESAANFLAEGADIAVQHGNSERAIELLLRTKFLLPESTEYRNRLIVQFTRMKDYHRAGFEILDLAEILYSNSQPDLATTLLDDSLQHPIPLSLKLQMIASLVNHGSSDKASRHLENCETSLTGDEEHADVTELYRLLRDLNPDQVDYHKKLIDRLTPLDPLHAQEATVESLEFFATRNEFDTVSSLLDSIVTSLPDLSHTAPQLLRMADLAERKDVFETLYQSNIQSIAEQAPELALTYAQRMLALNPYHPSASSDMALLLANLGQTEAAARQYAIVARSLMEAGDPDSAYQYIEEALALHPECLDALTCKLLLVAGSVSPEEVNALAAQVKAGISQTADEMSIAQATIAYIQVVPDSESILEESLARLAALPSQEGYMWLSTHKAALLAQNGQWAEARDVLSELSTRPDAPLSLHLQYAEVSLALQDADETATAFLRAASTCIVTGDQTAAIQHLESARNANPTSPSVLELLYRTADQLQQNAIAIHSVSSLTRHYSKNGPASSAARWAREWVRIDSAAGESHWLLARALKDSNQDEPAHTSYSTAATLLQTQGNPAEALQVLEECARHYRLDLRDLATLRAMEAASPDAHHSAALTALLAKALIHTGDLTQARTYLGQLPQSTDATALWLAAAREEKQPAIQETDFLNAAASAQQHDDPDQTIQILTEADSTLDDRVPVKIALADSYVSQGRYEEALPYELFVLADAAHSTDDQAVTTKLKTLRQRHSQDAPALYQIAQTLRNANRIDEARHDLEQAAAIALEKNDLDLLARITGYDEHLTLQSSILSKAKADALMGGANVSEALEWIKASYHTNQESGNATEALAMVRRWVALAPDDIDAWQQYIRTCEAASLQDDATAAHLQLARVMEKSGDLTGAVQLLTDLTERQSVPTDISTTLANLHQTAQQPDKAAAIYLNLATQQQAADDLPGALSFVRKSLELNSSDESAVKLLADLLFKKEGFAAAQPTYLQWLAIQKTSLSSEDYISALEQVLDKAPDNTTLLREITECHLASDYPQRAVPRLEHLGLILEMEGDLIGAAQTLDKLHSIQHNVTIDQLVNVANIYQQAGHHQVAEQRLRNAIDKATAKEEFNTAQKLYDRLLQLETSDEQHLSDLLQLAQIYHYQENTAKTATCLQEAVSLLEDSQTIAQANKLPYYQTITDLAPGNIDAVLGYLQILPPDAAIRTGLEKAAELHKATLLEESIRLYTFVADLAAHDMSVRQLILPPLRESRNTNRLRQELITLTNDAIAAGDLETAYSALDEASTLAETAIHFRNLAEANDKARRPIESARLYVHSATMFADDDKKDQAITSLSRAVSLAPDEINPEQIADLYVTLGNPVYEIARDRLRNALAKRKMSHSRVLATALLRNATPERSADILKTIEQLGGNSFTIEISREHLADLIDREQHTHALAFIDQVVSLAPDSPDTWQLAAQNYYALGQMSDTVRCSMEAARLYQMTGGIIEEEEAYQLALKADSTDLNVKSTLLDYYSRENREDEVMALLQEIIDQAEDDNNTNVLIDYLNRFVQFAPGHTAIRQKLAVQLESIAPDSAVEQWLETAQIFSFQGEWDSATTIYKHVLNLSPSNETALSALVKISDRHNETGDLARYTQELARIKAARSSYTEACELLKSYLENEPQNIAVSEQLSQLSAHLEDPELFITSNASLAQKYQRQGLYPEAIQKFEAVLRHRPKDTRVLANLIDCCAAIGLPDQGITYAKQLLHVAREAEDPEQVQHACMTLISFDESDADAYNDLGEALLSLNKPTQAVTEWLRGAELYEARGSTASAYSCYRKITRINPTLVHAWRRLADIALTIGDWESARHAVLHLLEKYNDAKEESKNAALLHRLLEVCPDDELVHTGALQFYQSHGDIENQINEYLWLAEAASKRQDDQEAERYLNQALQIAPANDDIKKAHYEVILKLGKQEELQIRLRKEADQLQAAGNVTGSIDILKELCNLIPDQITVHRELARLLDSEKRKDEAFEYHINVLRLLLDKEDNETAREFAEDLADDRPRDAAAREQIADALAAGTKPDVAGRHYMIAAKLHGTVKDPEKAIELYARAVAVRPTWIDAREALATACEKAGLHDRAMHEWLELAGLLIDESDYNEATDILGRLSRTYPDQAEIKVQLANLYEKTGEADKQISLLQEIASHYEVLASEPEAMEFYKRLTYLLPNDSAVLTRYVELLTQYSDTVEDPDAEFARLAELLAHCTDVETSMQTYEQLIGLNPANSSVRSRYATYLLNRGSRNRALMEMKTLATHYMDTGDPASAVEIYNAALTISPRDADLCLALASAQEAAGFTDDAKVSYARASAILASTAAVKGIDTYRRILSEDEQNTAVRYRLVELLMNSGDRMEAAREARILAELFTARGDFAEAEKAYRIVDQCEPESLEEIQSAIQRDSYDPSLQYVHYVRLGNLLFEQGDIDNALDAYRTARSLHDDQTEIIQKCIECISLIAPEAEAIPDYLLMGEKLLLQGNLEEARQTYNKVRLIDPFNNDARCGLEATEAVLRSSNSHQNVNSDDQILKTRKPVNKRVAIMDLLVACQDASQDESINQKLGITPPSSS